MSLKIRLSNQYAGAVLLEDDPVNLQDFEVMVRRSQANEGVVYEAALNLQLIKEGRRFCQQVYEDHGIESTIFVDIFIWNPNTYKWAEYFTGELKMDNYDIGEIDLKTSVEQKGFQRKFLSLSANDVDLGGERSFDNANIPPAPIIPQLYHAKKILKIAQLLPGDGNQFFQSDALHMDMSGGSDGYLGFDGRLIYGQVSTEDKKIDDVLDTFALPFGFDSTPIANVKHRPGTSSVNQDDVVYFNVDGNDSVAISLVNSNTTPIVDGANWKIGLLEVLKRKKSPRNELYAVAVSEAGIVDVDIQLKLQHLIDVTSNSMKVKSPCSSTSNIGHREIRCFFEHRDAADNILRIDEFGNWLTIRGCGRQISGSNIVRSDYETKSLQIPGITTSVGDKMYVYYVVMMYGWYDASFETNIQHDLAVQADTSQTWVKITAASAGNAPSVSKSVLIFEALQKVSSWITGETTSFKSDFFGRTDSSPAYGSDGEGSLTMITNGRNLRNSGDEKIFANWDSLYGALNTIYCLGWGFEKDNGNQVVRVEKKSHFYDKNNIILELSDVKDLRKKVATDEYYNIIDFAYPKLDVKQKNGIDEFNTIRQYGVPYTKSKNKVDVKSQYRTAGYEIEGQRRLIGKTEDSKIDSDNFLIAVVRSGSATGYDTEKNAGYTLANIFDPASVYNIRFAPVRCLKRWSQVFAGVVQKLMSKVITFNSGDFNYQAGSQLNATETEILYENSNIDLSAVEPLWYPEIYTFTSPLSKEEFKLVRDNPYGVIKFTDSFDITYEGYVIQVKHKAIKETGTFELLRVFRPK